ncbi:LacI family DNA-binding transcriptional regulator [Actinophytocola algeriensis]|uniref:DNA-binding LacI/PurR family transcriptional regulator n=1 Tax=Actinophytocola algeriensis TaxID=1768010 RepID=A0A7W7Q9D2_9PSEU|nr:LacI family DNA-binding transcriptional regulator [Actinophytocola algeriensis]MBB4909293.1 DNA-binding LacI/PurR family transcriptional regulator [Actinophytocola algeriensis]MBE1475283.1 DNA-binding LacI/PurR family transcriptional regulator [Actinophytocola algeriensis]
MRDATLRDVARLAGVSARTVSNVVNGYARVSERTREKVERALVELRYRPNVLARNLARGRSGQIAVVVPYLDTPYFAELLQAIIPRARERGYNVLIDQTDGDAVHERELISRGARAFLFDGMIFSPLGLAQEDLVEIDPDLPLVILGERVSNGVFDHVGIDDVEASRAATAHLIGLGRRRIAAIGDQPYPTGEAAQLRTRGFRQAHADAGLPVDESLIIPTPRFNRADGSGAMRALLSRAEPPDAVFCYSDLVALGALHTALESGLRVPEDLALIGYDDIEEGRYANPAISTVSPDKVAIAATAVDRLLTRIGSAEPVPGIEVRAEHRLIPRESTIGRTPPVS